MGETENTQAEAHDLSGRSQQDRRRAKSAVGEGKERSLTEGIRRVVWAMARTSVCQLSNVKVTIQNGASLYHDFWLF